MVTAAAVWGARRSSKSAFHAHLTSTTIRDVQFTGEVETGTHREEETELSWGEAGPASLSLGHLLASPGSRLSSTPCLGDWARVPAGDSGSVAHCFTRTSSLASQVHTPPGNPVKLAFVSQAMIMELVSATLSVFQCWY